MTPQKQLTLTEVRRILPRRALSYDEAITVAEHQANRLAQALGADQRSIQEAALTSLTRMEIVRSSFESDDHHSGSSSYQAGRWIVQLDASESAARQRFTLAHELKHIIDAGSGHAYRQLTDHQIERVCDHFAGCLLMSKRAVYRLWGDGLRTPEALASACRVSLAAMKVRLSIMGLPINSGPRQRFSCRAAYRTGALSESLRTSESAVSGEIAQGVPA